MNEPTNTIVGGQMKIKLGALLLMSFFFVAVVHAAEMAAADHVVQTLDTIQWQPSEFPGLSMAVLQGDPSKAGELFTIVFKAPAGFKFPPHWHPTDESVFVLEGKLGLGMGDVMDDSGAEVGSGSYARVSKDAHHYAWSKEGATFSVHAMGPFAITFVNPKDDPRPSKK
jgi:quercetin dioxygenase-like cupin family protein